MTIHPKLIENARTITNGLIFQQNLKVEREEREKGGGGGVNALDRVSLRQILTIFKILQNTIHKG